jgi:hypothetical protein
LLKKLEKLERNNQREKDLRERIFREKELKEKELREKDLREKELIVYYEARIETIYQNVLKLVAEGSRAGGGELAPATFIQKNSSMGN